MIAFMETRRAYHAEGGSLMALAHAAIPQEKPGFVLAGRVRIRTAAWPSEGYPTVLVHGLSSGWQTWLPPLPYLWPTLSLTALDLRGHGDSDKPEAEYTLAHYVADVWTVLGKLRFKRPPVLIGHSLGGAVVRRLAAEHADALAAVVIEDSKLWHRSEYTPDEAEAFGQERLASARRPFPDLVQAEMDNDPRLSYRQAMEKAQRLANTADGVFLGIRNGVELAEGEEYADLLPRITCPALLIRGETERGGVVDEADAARQQALAPHLSVVQVPDVGHGIHGQQPEAFATAVLDFLRDAGVTSHE